MKLTLKGIREINKWESAGIRLSQYDIEKMREKTVSKPIWLHFGAGNIFRIFIGGIGERLIEKGKSDRGIICAETFDFEVIDKIYKPFDNLVLSVTLNSDGTTKKEVTASIAEGFKANRDFNEDWERLKEIFKSQSLEMVSFTITEKGYALYDSEGKLLPYIERDIEKGPEGSGSAMAVTASLLYERYKNGATPLALVSMDNCSQNGERLKKAVTEIACLWQKKGYTDMGFIDYINSKVSFPWTMIDKITPRPSERVEKELENGGVEDMDIIVTSKNTHIAPFVNGEAPQYLVIEDSFPNGRPALEEAGVYMTDRRAVELSEKMKVTACLNPLHTALAVFGCLLGYRLISDEMQDRDIKQLVEILGIREGLDEVQDPGIFSPLVFVNEVINERFTNPYMPDSPQRIATDTSQKVGIRFGETIRSAYKNGRAEGLRAVPLAIAAWCRYLMGIDDEGRSMELSPDPMLKELKEELKGVSLGNKGNSRYIKSILENDNIFGVNLYDVGLGEKIELMFEEMTEGEGAVRRTLKKWIENK